MNISWTFSFIVLGILITPIAEAQSAVRLIIPPQPLADSLRAVANKTSINVLFDPRLVEGRRAPALNGQFTAEQAFSSLLAQTGLHYRFLDERTLTIAGAGQSPGLHDLSSSGNSTNEERAAKPFNADQTDQGQTGPTSAVPQNAGPNQSSTLFRCQPKSPTRNDEICARAYPSGVEPIRNATSRGTTR